MKYSNTVEYNINTKLDSSGLTKLQSQIKQVELSLQRMGDKEFLNSDRVGEARKQLEGLNTSLTKSFNSSLGILDLSKLQKELQTAGVDATGLGTAFNMAGSQGQAALNSLITQIGNFNGGIERTSSQIDKIFTTFSNTFRWGLVSSFFSQFMNAIHSSVDYVKELDDSLTQIMLVTDYNRDSMNEFAKSANEAAKAVSMTTTGMTNASLIFAQQGYDLNQSQELATLSAKLANASQQDTATTSDQITAYMNAYGLEGSIEELTQQMDNWALIANVSAADVGELAQASQRAASMANAVGVSGEQLAAQIATIESVTREAPEQIGNGLKTLYARFSDIAAGEEDEDGFSLGKVTSELNKIGVQVLDEMGQIRDVGDIMEDLMVIWDDLDQTSKVAASQALAGKYQVNRFMALMDNSDMYQEYKGATGSAATGTLDQMNQEYAESLVGRTQKLNATLEGLFNDVFTTDMVYPLIDALTKLADGLDTVFKSIGDGPTILLTLASAFGQLFSTNIARSINNIVSNQQLQEVRKNNIANVGNVLDQLGLGNSEMGQYIKTMAENAPKMNQEQYDQYMAALQDWSNTTTQLAAKEEELQGTLDVLNMVYGTKLKTPSAVNKDDETGKISFTEAEEARANLSNKQLTALASKEDFVEETQQIMSLSKELGKAQTAYENFKSGIVDADKALQMFDLASDQVGQQLESLKKAGILSEASFDQLNETFKQVTNGLITGTDDIDQLEQELDELIRRFVNLGEAASSMDPNTFKRWILSGIEQAKKQEQELQGIRAQDEQNKDTAQGQIENIVSQNAVEGVIKVTSSLGELASAIMTIQNLGQIFTDDDLSPMEKFVQILTGIGVLIPTIIISVKEFAEGVKLLKDAKIAENIVEAISQGLIISNIRLKKQQLIVDTELIAMDKALAMAEGEASGAGLFFAGVLTTIRGAATSALAALGPVGLAIAAIGVVAGTVMAGIKISDFIGDLQEAEAQQQALNELTDQTAETVKELNNTAPALNELYDAYKETGEASDEFKQSLADQAELLGINDAALLISQGKYDELKVKIDEATEAIYNNNAALQQAKLDKINSNDIVNELSNDQKERYGITYHQEEGITGLNGGTAEKGLVNKIDQTPYELIRAAQQDIETQQEKINSLTQKRNDLVKEGLTATGEASQKITEDITKVDNEIAEAAQKLAESKEFTENNSEILEAINTIRDNALEQELSNPDSIFKTGSYEDINKFISAQQGVNSSNINELIQKYADLTGNIDAATEATLKLRDQQIKNNELVTDDQTGIQYRAGEKGKFLIDEIGKQQDWSDEDKAKISNMIDWSDPDVDQKVIELLERIQQGLNDGLSLDEALKIQNPEDVKAAIAEMEPKDTDLEVGPYREMAEYLREYAGELEGIPEQVGQNSEMLQDFTEAILRYDNAIQDADENLSDWKDLLLNTAEAAEDDATYLEDLMEAFEGMRDMIGDLLDMDVSDLSQQFMQNADVLDILDKAIYGVGEEADLAYDQLNYLAQLDMAGLVDWTDGIDDELAAWDNALPSLEANMDSLSVTAAELGDNASYAMGIIQDVLGGTIPGPDLDLSAFIAGLEQMVNSGQMSVQQAMAVIDGAGYSAEVTQGEAEGTNVESHIDATPEETPGVSIDSQITGTVTSNATGPAALQDALSGSGTTTVSWQGNVPGIKWNMTPAEESTDVKANATGVKYKATTGGGGGAGQIHFTNVKSKPSGSTKRNTSGNGSHSRPSSTGRGSCFVAGTLISTWGGFKPIEQIKKGNIVLSYNEQTGLNEYSEVLQTMIHDTTELIYTLYIKDEQLRVTGIHRFLIVDKITCGVLQWVHAADLKVGDWVMFADGSWHVIHKIEKHLEHQIVYNFEVSGNHNYYVGRNQILAHNKGGKSCFVAGTQVSTSLGFKNIETIKPRDIVLSYNEQTKQNEYSSVIQTMIHNTKESIYTLYIKNEKLKVTGIHRFFITHNIIDKTTQWIQVENLHVGDWVLCADGTWHVIWKIEINIEQQTVYNFEVSNNHNYYVGRNQILAHNKGGKKGGGKKGGGGGKAKTIEPKEKKEHEKDYYEEVNSQLDKTEKLLSKIEKEEDRLIGDKAQANQNKQLNLLQKEVELNKEKLKLQRQELRDVDKRIKKQDKLAEKLAAKNGVPFNIPDVILDEDGMVANYEQISSRLDQIHNKLIDKYNAAAAAGNEELTKEIQKTIDKFDGYSKEILENAKRHNKLQTEIVETNNNLEELDDTIEDIRIDAFKAHQEAMEELTELSEQAAEINTIFRDFNEDGFLTAWSLDENPIDDMTESMYNLSHAYGMTKKDAQNFYQTLINEEKKRLETTKDKDERKAIKSTISYYQQQKKNVNSQSLQNGELGMWTGELTRLEGWINGTSKEENPFGENTAALWDAYKNAYEHALEAFKKQKEEVQKLRDSIIDAYDEQEKALERNLDKYNRLLDKLERVNDTYQLYYGEDNYEQILDLMEQQGNTMESQLNQLNNAYTYWSNQYKEAINSGDKKLIEEIEDKMNDAEDAMLDKAEELAEHWVEMFEKSVEANTQSIYNKLFNNKDIEELTSNWELQKDYMQRYKDDIEKTYELDKLRSKYIDLLNDAQGSSLQIQNKIRQQMQEQLKQLQDQATVSEYDVKLANAKLEILQKQIALEDAQRNKNQMQLRRDTQGNYRYVYRANQDDVKAAQDDLLDSEYNAYELTKNETIANNDRALALVQDFLAKRADIFNKYKDDDEARTKALAELSANYSQLLGALEEDFKNTTNGMYDVLTYLVQNATGDTSVSAMEMLNDLFDEEGKFKDDTEVLWADLANTVTGMLENFENTVNEANASMIDNAQSLKEKMVGANGVLTQIGSSADTITSSMNDAAIATDTLTTATDNLFTLFTSDDKNFKAALTKIKNYEEQLKNTQNTTSMLASQLGNANQQITALTAQNTNYKTTLDLSTGAKNFEVGGEYTLKAGAPVRFDRGTGSQYYIDEKGQKQYGFKIPRTMKVKIGDLNQTINGKRAPYPISLYPTGSSLKEWGALEKETSGNSQTFESLKHQGWHITEEDMRKYLTYKSGGYTGNWNEETVEKDNGKLAFLHQKELVLNAKDTENILSAVSLMRDIIKGNVNGIFDIGNLYKSKLSSLYNPVTEQRVEIKASFPNATDAEDIKQALIDLSDKAYQYAHRRNTFLG